MNLVLARYLATHFVKAAAVVLALLLTLFSFLALTETLEDVGKGAFTVADAVSVVLLTLPARMLDLMPVTALLGSVIGLGLLANNSELTAMRAAGVSSWQLVRVQGVLAAALALLVLLLQFMVMPAAERKAQDFRTRTFEQTAIGDARFWSRRDRRMVRVGSVEFGRIPRDIEIYELDRDDRLVRVLRAARADVVSNDQWLLHEVEEKVLEATTIRHRRLVSMRWESFLTPEQVATLIAPAHALSPADLWRYLRETRGAGVDTREQQARFWHQVSLPVTLLGMMLLGVPLVLASLQTRSTGLRATVGAGVGIAFYLFEQITSQLTLILDLNPLATALLPGVVVLGGALLAVRRLP
ncbi:MAG: LPS export ABC transporter permease LptG [Gammaproteobacteria bacterium]